MFRTVQVTRLSAFTLRTVLDRTFWAPQSITSKVTTTRFTPTTSHSTTTTLVRESCAMKHRVCYVLSQA